jgi:hypothetical protein
LVAVLAITRFGAETIKISSSVVPIEARDHPKVAPCLQVAGVMFLDEDDTAGPASASEDQR